MFKIAALPKTTLSNRWVTLWATRYLPDQVRMVLPLDPMQQLDRLETANFNGRQRTIEKIRKTLRLHCDMAGVETMALFARVMNLMNLAEVRSLTDSVYHVYETLLTIYESQRFPNHYLECADSPNPELAKIALAGQLLPAFYELVDTLEPLLVNVQEEHLAASDPRTIGFITTQFHFSSQAVLRNLTEHEQLFLKPYFQFVEEQVCIPWQRICAAAETCATDPERLALVEQMLPVSHTIAERVYQKAVHHYPHHRSRQGWIQSPGVKASSLRDLNMFQGYLWLCVVEKSMAVIEEEFLPLCLLVFPSINVKWPFVEQGVRWLTEAIASELTPTQRTVFAPYAEALQGLFLNQYPAYPTV